MDFTVVFGLIAKGLTVVQALYQAEQDAAPAIKALYDLATGAQTGEVTDEQLTETEALLDSLIEQFNIELPA